MGLSATEIDILDMYEDEEYDKRVVDVSLLDASEVLQAYTYVWANSTDPDLYGEWDFEEFKESKLKGYLEMTKNYVEVLEDTETSLP
ncbi:AIG2-like protein D [Bidens hawaiensis]|uniref:AIG2-like protein D n=1 Tax=Bidens hawaiensis TaxID=980011 RepID=UPI00404B5EA8